MADGRFVLNKAGVGELLKSSEMMSVLESYADKVADNAGEGYKTFVGFDRAHVSVRTVTDEAYQDNLDNNTLLKASGEYYD